MRSEVALRVEAMAILIKKLGEIDAERFITIVKSDNFDYTEWQRNLWNGKSIDEIHHMATKFEKTEFQKV
jgi:hypothetical protein